MLTTVHVVLTFALALALARHWQATKNKLYWLSFAFHMAAGICVGLIYSHYYSANDTWLFFEDAKTLSQMARENWTSYVSTLVSTHPIATDLVTHDFRSTVFIKILSAFSLVTGDNYWLCAAYFALLSFVSSWFLFRRVTTYFEQSQVAATLAFLVFPSGVFWSSGIEKETLTLTALYFLTGLFLQFMLDVKISWRHWILAVFAVFVLWALKYYWAGVFFIAVLASVLTSYLIKQGSMKKYIVVTYIACFALIGIGISFLHPNFYLHRFLEVVASNHDAFVSLSSDKNLIHYYELTPTVTSMAINTPWAVVSGVFRPFIGEGQGALGLAASLENLLILALALSSVWRILRRPRGSLNILFLAAMSYCMVLCVFLALSTPNLGTLSRYRVGFLPFLIFIFAYRNPPIDFIEKKLSSSQ